MSVRPFVRSLVSQSRSILDRENADMRAEWLKKRVPSRHLVPDLRDRSRPGVIAEFCRFLMLVLVESDVGTEQGFSTVLICKQKTSQSTGNRQRVLSCPTKLNLIQNFVDFGSSKVIILCYLKSTSGDFVTTDLELIGFELFLSSVGIVRPASEL